MARGDTAKLQQKIGLAAVGVMGFVLLVGYALTGGASPPPGEAREGALAAPPAAPQERPAASDPSPRVPGPNPPPSDPSPRVPGPNPPRERGGSARGAEERTLALADDLPGNVDSAFEIVRYYERKRPNDRAKLISLFKQLASRLPAGRELNYVHKRLGELEGAAAKELRTRFDFYLDRVREASKREDYAAARRALQEAKRVFADADTIAVIDDELNGVAKAEEETAFVVGALSDLEALGEAEATRRLAAVLAKLERIEGRPTWRRAWAHASSLRQRRRAALRERAEARLETARKHHRGQTRRDSANWEERTTLAAKRSQDRPIPFVGGARLKALTATRFTLTTHGGRGEVTLAYGQRPALTVEVLNRARRKDHPEDLTHLIWFALRQRLFTQGKRSETKLSKLYPEAAKGMPEVRLLERAARPFRGDPLEGAVTPGGSYDFRKENAAEFLADWKAGRDTKVSLSKGVGVRLTGRSPTLWLKELTLAGPLELSFRVPQGAHGLVIARLDAWGDSGQRVLVYVDTNRHTATLQVALSRGKYERFETLSLGGRSARIQLRLTPTQAILSAGGSTTRAALKPYARAEVLLGAPRDGQKTSTVTWSLVTIQAALSSTWLVKQQAAYSSMLWRESEGRDLLAAAGATVAAQKTLDLPIPFTGLPPCDDGFVLAGLSPALLVRYRSAWDSLREGRPKDAFPAFDDAVLAQERHAGAFYGRALTRWLEDDYRGCLGDLDLAISLDDRAAELHVAKAFVQLYLGRGEDARVAVERALGLSPDMALAYRLRGLQRMQAGEFPEAATDLGLTLALDPGDRVARRYAQKVAQVAAGPPWAKTYRVETPSYVVLTDIGQHRAKEIGRQLEAAIGLYKGALGYTRPGAPGPKPKCLVFNTALGYANYSSLISFDGHDDSTLGYYSPLFQQLVLFEDRNDPNHSRLRRVLVHEGFHRYSAEQFSTVPTWFGEGMAEYFAGKALARDGVLKGRSSSFRSALEEKRVPALKALLDMSQSRFYGQGAAVNYAGAWVLCHYLMQASQRDESARAVIPALIKELRAGAPPARAQELAFEGVDLRALERRWHDHAGSL